MTHCLSLTGARQGVAITAIVAIAAIALTLTACGGGKAPTPALDGPAFQQAYDGLERMTDAGEAGDADAAQEAYVEVQPFLRDVNGALAARPEEVIARAELIDAITRIELELGHERRADVLAGLAEAASRALENAAEILDEAASQASGQQGD